MKQEEAPLWFKVLVYIIAIPFTVLAVIAASLFLLALIKLSWNFLRG